MPSNFHGCLEDYSFDNHADFHYFFLLGKEGTEVCRKDLLAAKQFAESIAIITPVLAKEFNDVSTPEQSSPQIHYRSPFSINP